MNLLEFLFLLMIIFARSWFYETKQLAVYQSKEFSLIIAELFILIVSSENFFLKKLNVLLNSTMIDELSFFWNKIKIIAYVMDNF
jgi:hypothetical protein